MTSVQVPQKSDRLAEREVTNTYRERFKNLDAVKNGLQDLINGLDDTDKDMQQTYDDIADDIKNQTDQFKDLSQQYNDQVKKRENAANEAQSLLDELNKPKVADNTQKTGNDNTEYELVDEDVKEWEENMNIKVPDLALPELPDLREPLEIKPFQKVPVLHGAMVYGYIYIIIYCIYVECVSEYILDYFVYIEYIIIG